jgi:putative ABC transport system permease protein
MADVSHRTPARRWLADILQDLRYAVRTWRKTPSVTVISVLTLGLGIGATTTIASVVDTILLRPLPFTGSDRLVELVQNTPPGPGGRNPGTRRFTFAEFTEWKQRTTTLEGVAATSWSIGMVKTERGTARLWGAAVSGETFSMLGARAMLGRTLVAADDHQPDVVLLPHETWTRQFQSSPEIVGRTLEFLTSDSSRLMTVVGVMPPDFEFPTGRFEYFTPIPTAARAKPSPSLTLIARVRPDVSPEAAAQEAIVIGTAITKPLPANAPTIPLPRFELRNLKESAVKELRPALRVFFAAVVVVLLIVCANVANLLLARGTARQHEMAVRFAIGASRGRIIRQMMTECLLLAMVGGLFGALLATGGVLLVKDLASIDTPGIFRLTIGATILPRVHEIGIDLKMFGIAFGLAALTSVACGLLPALTLSRANLVQAFSARGGSANRGAARLRGLLVVGQLAMATVLLIGAGLLIHSFGRLLAVDRGYNPEHALAFQLVFPPDYSIARKTESIEGILSKLRSMPDAVASGFTRHGVLIGEAITIGTFVPHGRTREEMEAQNVRPLLRPVSGGYLTAVGARMIQGTDLNPLDTARPAGIVISERTARLFGRGRHIGRLVDWHVNSKVVIPLQVVGIVNDVRNEEADREPPAEVFLDYREALKMSQQIGDAPIMQNERALGLLSFAVRMRGEPAAAVPAVSEIVRTVDPNAGIDAIVPIDRLVASSVARPRFYAVLLGLFATVAGLLAAIGVYGVLAYAVTQRTQEFGIRMALGAQRRHILTLVLRRGLVLTLVGVTLGLAAAAASARVLETMLFGVTPLDRATYAAVAIAFTLVAFSASYLPARRATAVDPTIALSRE